MKETETRFTTDALVIKEMSVGESDRLVTLFTRDYGLIRAFAAGAKSVRSKKGAATSLLTYGSFTLLRKKDTYKIYEAVPIKMFFTMGGDIELLTLEQYFCELAGVLCPSDEPAEDFLRLMLNCLKFLEEERLPENQIKAIFEMQMMRLSGYRPDLSGCGICGREENLFFDMHEGTVFCAEHKKGGKALCRDILSALRLISDNGMKKAFFFSLPEEKLGELSKITGEYVRLRLERSFNTLDFYETITS